MALLFRHQHFCRECNETRDCVLLNCSADDDSTCEACARHNQTSSYLVEIEMPQREDRADRRQVIDTDDYHLV